MTENTTDSPAPAESAPAVEHSGEPSLELRHLHRFFGRLKAVDDVSFKAYPGQVIGYIGPNGAGKTTSMRILSTLDVPTAGDAFICGYSVVDDPDKVRRYLGFMPDSFGRYPNMNVVEYLDFYARAYGLTGARRRDAVEHVLVFTDLQKLADKTINTLSKGMAQRLGLGRCLVHDPQVMVLDEPAAGLDPRARVELRELIRLLATRMKKTVLISSHILTELGEICDSVAIIEAGRILAHGTIQEIEKQQRMISGNTAARTLLARIASADDLDAQTDRLEKWLLEQPHVTHVECIHGQATFHLEDNNEGQQALLKRLIDEGFPMIEFHGKSQTLEDTFMNITQGITQ
ncbi:MAG: ABC transporter ATP-binding protein [Planctomycetaceae bacterium]